MSVAWVGLGVSVIGGIASSNKQDKANQASADWSKQMYANSQNYFNQQAGLNEGFYAMGMDMLWSDRAHMTPSMASASMATAYEMEAYKAETYQAEMDGFLEAFKDASESADLSLDTFTRRYGQIMDNLEQSILDADRERFAASGRERLMLDADTMKKNLNNSIARAGLTRSGVTMEMQSRMDMDIARQAREIDVNSYAQAGQLQAAGTQALGGLTQLRESIAARGEAYDIGRGQGILQTNMFNAQQQQQGSQFNARQQQEASRVNAQNQTNVSMQNASNKTNVSLANAGARNQASMFNAGVDNSQKTSIANAYLGRAQSGYNAANSFYSGVGQQGASGVANTYNNMATGYGQDAAGYAKFGGYLMNNAMNGPSNYNGNSSAYNWYMGTTSNDGTKY